LSSDRPVITCPPTLASLGDRNVALRCEVSAQPSLTALFWIIDVNGTTVSEGQVINEYWTVVIVSTCDVFFGHMVEDYCIDVDVSIINQQETAT
jgi:hypothetical protein